MTNTTQILQEAKVAAAFDKQAAIFDRIFSTNTIIEYKRKRVRDHVLQYLQPCSKILELNTGTGDDAIFFAKEGHFIHATDISSEMLKKLSQKVKENNFENKITYEQCSFTSLGNLNLNGKFDLIFSNFAGLNCTNELDKVLESFSSLLNKKGIVTLVILPKFCLWETMLMFKGKFKTAFRRFVSGQGTKANIEGDFIRCWYYNPSFIKKKLKDDFDVLRVEGLCTFVPPSYIENFVERHPKMFKFLKQAEMKLKNKWPWRSIGDYYIISLKKKK
jgi:ubiquinone/menaquinone biosynthesis C-methylase UbiE